MVGLNDCNLIGNIVRDAELKTKMVGSVPTPCCTFAIAVNEKRRTKELITSYFEVTIWRDQATSLASWLKKGRLVHVSGSVRQNKYRTAEGLERVVMQVHDVRNVLLLDRKPHEETQDDEFPI